MLKKRSIWMSMLCALFVAAANLAAAEVPAVAMPEDRSEAAIRRFFAENTTKGVVKGLQLQGKLPPSKEQQEQIYRIVYDTFPEVIARIKRAGLYDEYTALLFDREIRELDQQSLNAKSLQEVMTLMHKLMALFSERYPRVYQLMTADRELNGITMLMMQKIAAVCK